MPRGDRFFDHEDNPYWYQDAIIYELHVRAFADGDRDGIGDFRGLIEKLDYLQDLGITAIWLLPFYPSPLKDDGYDIADYRDVHPAYGTLADFKELLHAAHLRGLRVITELVVNHTSDQHPWFQRARRAGPGSRPRDYYVWSDTPDRYREARIIFKDFESSNWAWDPVAKAYYWHRFYSHQPDLNYDNPEVQRAITRVMDFWLKLGVDGLRLDAVPYLYEREGTNCENLPETHAFLRALRQHVDQKFKNRMLLAEANQWPEDAAAYFGEGDECHMAFHFPVMPRLFMAIHMEDRFPIIEIMQQTPPIPDIARWAFFLRNHDELTLEMVTDEERDYMYRVYANDPRARVNLGIRRRLAPLLENNRRRIELMYGLLFSLPGTPIIYYGDEIGMGDNIYLGDRNSVRTPMQWSADRNAGFSRANPQQLYLPTIIDPEYHYEAVNVEVQQNNPTSLLWWVKRLIALRKRYKAFGHGTLEFLQPENRKVLVFLRRFGDESILVAANLSRFTQYVELDLSTFNGFIPMEVFGQTKFPAIGELPYFLTLGPHAFYWFALTPQLVAPAAMAVERRIPSIRVRNVWTEVFSGKGEDAFARILPDYLRSRPWFARKGHVVHSTRVVETIPMSSDSCIAIVRIAFTEGEPAQYVLPLTFVEGEEGEGLVHTLPGAVVTRIEGQTQSGVICDGMWNDEFCQLLLKAVGRGRRFEGNHGAIVTSRTQVFRKVRGPAKERLASSVLTGVEQSNTSVTYGDRLILKLFRRFGEGTNPDLEIGRFLTEKARFQGIPPVVGSIEYHRNRGEPSTIGILQGYVQNEGSAWRFTLGALSHYFERTLTQPMTTEEELVLPTESLLARLDQQLPALASDMIGPYLEMAQLLGKRTAELHLALASDSEDLEFAPEPFSTLYQRSLYQSLRNRTRPVLQLLRQRLPELPEEAQEDGQMLLDRETDVLHRYRAILNRRIRAMRIRCHGDYRLGQVLYTGKDFVMLDFEGDTNRPLSETKIKRSPLRDVASMLISLFLASHAALLNEVEGVVVRPEDQDAAQDWALYWYVWVSTVFLQSYLSEADGVSFMPSSREDLRLLLDLYLLEKSIQQLRYELDNRTPWVRVALHAILYHLKAGV